MELNSGVKFHEAQVALARQWISGDTLTEQKEVTLTLPPPSTGEGIVISDKTPAKTTETIKIPETEEEAQRIVARFERGADSIRGDEDVADNVAQHMLRDGSGTQGLAAERWLGSEEEEVAAYVSELLYIHTKLMIVDDRKVIVSSTAFFWVVG